MTFWDLYDEPKQVTIETSETIISGQPQKDTTSNEVLDTKVCPEDGCMMQPVEKAGESEETNG